MMNAKLALKGNGGECKCIFAKALHSIILFFHLAVSKGGIQGKWPFL